MKSLLNHRLAERGSRRPRRSLPAWRVVVASLAVASTALISGCSQLYAASDAYTRGQLDLVETFTGEREPGQEWYYLDGADKTAEICGPQTNCVQAVGNEYLTLLKFENVADAADYTATLGSDGVQFDPLVINFNGIPLPAKEREGVIYTFSTFNAGSWD